MRNTILFHQCGWSMSSVVMDIIFILDIACNSTVVVMTRNWKGVCGVTGVGCKMS